MTNQVLSDWLDGDSVALWGDTGQGGVGGGGEQQEAGAGAVVEGSGVLLEGGQGGGALTLQHQQGVT